MPGSRARCASMRLPAPPDHALMPLVMEFLQHHLKIHIDLVTEGRLVDIVADCFDFGVRSESLVPNDMIVIPSARHKGTPWSVRRRTLKNTANRELHPSCSSIGAFAFDYRMGEFPPRGISSETQK